MIKFLILLLIPLVSFANDRTPYYGSLSQTESWLRHYPNKFDFKDETEKFFLTQKNMPVKVIQEHISEGNDFEDWYRIQLFNGIEGWIYHTQLNKRKRSLLILEDTELYALNSFESNSWLTIKKGEILSPKIVDLLKVTPTMFKVSILLDERKKIKGWIIRDDRVWGDDPNELEKDFD